MARQQQPLGDPESGVVAGQIGHRRPMLRSSTPRSWIMRHLVITGILLGLVPGVATAQVRVLQTNSRGDNIHLIDPATNKIVGEITGVPINHGAAAAPDGSRFYFSSEAEQTLTVVDGKTLQVTKKIPLTGRP